MKVCVQGLWHLGTVTVGCLAAVGHEVIGLDFDSTRVHGLCAGQPPLFEPGLTELIGGGLASGRLRFTARGEDIPSDLEVLWVTYDTPVDEDDAADVDFVVGQIMAVLPFLSPNATVLVSSQLPVGSIRRLEALVDQLCPAKGLGFAYSPENLRLGKAIEAFMKPDRVVVGARNTRDQERVRRLLAPITDRIEWMVIESAEMTKHAINAFLATSVVFANEIASICELVGADAKEVERGLKTERRIGPLAYVAPGEAFAGGTLARDIEFLRVEGQTHQLTLPLLESVRTSNNLHKAWVRRKLKSLLPTLEGVAVAVWGLTYKPGTDTLRRSLAIELCDWLLEQGAELRVHDPAVKELPKSWGGRVRRFSEVLDTLPGAKVLTLGTPWAEYKEIPRELVTTAAPGLVVLDPGRFLSSYAEEPGLCYFAVGSLKTGKMS